jgi:periplasmic divalent cation tolerance protein
MIRLFYVTFPNLSEAQKCSKALLNERLVACANIHKGGIESMYWWEGQIEENSEVAVFFKSDSRNSSAITQKIKDMHPYETPCIVAIDITAGNREFLQWVQTESSTKTGQ